jgi:5,10-methylenetetrahydromethanopterin reductase
MIEFGHCTIAAPFQAAKLAREDEDFGFDVRYIGDNHSIHPDPMVALFEAARATTRIRLGTGVTNTVTRHPSVLASQMASLQLASGGRAILGIGKGDSVVAMVGKQPQRHAEFVENTRLLRGYLHREKGALGRYDNGLAWLEGQNYTPVPIEIACAGPKTLHAAAALADRIQLTVGAPLERIRWALGVIDEGLAAAGRKRSDIQIGVFPPLVVDDSRAAAAERLRTGVAVIAHMSALPGIDLSHQPERLRNVTIRLREAYNYRHHNMEQANPMRDLVDAEFADWYGIGGPADYIVERLGAIVELGIDFIFLGTIPLAEREVLAAKVMPVIAKMRDGREKARR